MDEQFWYQRWQANTIGFHRSAVSPLLARYFDRLSFATDRRVFVPLCGKTLDIGWLLTQGCQVVGVEFNESAVTQLFDELGIAPELTNQSGLKRYRAPNIDIYQGDFFLLTRDLIGAIDAVFDRAAFVALPAASRIRYAQHLVELTAKAPQLLITYEYDKTQMDGPPFAIDGSEVFDRYGSSYAVESLEITDVSGGLKGKPASERIWLLGASQ